MVNSLGTVYTNKSKDGTNYLTLNKKKKIGQESKHIHEERKKQSLLSTPPTVATSQAAHKNSHRLIRTSRLQRIMCGFRALATPAAELSSLVGVDAIRLQDLRPCDLVQISSSSHHGGLGGLLALPAHLGGSQLRGAEVHHLVHGHATLHDVGAQAL